MIDGVVNLLDAFALTLGEQSNEVCDQERDLSDVVILDAQDFVGEPIATIRLPVRVPHGFHGGWAPDKITVIE